MNKRLSAAQCIFNLFLMNMIVISSGMSAELSPQEKVDLFKPSQRADSKHSGSFQCKSDLSGSRAKTCGGRGGDRHGLFPGTV